MNDRSCFKFLGADGDKIAAVFDSSGAISD